MNNFDNRCSHCRSDDPVGGLRRTSRRLPDNRSEDVLLCELCDQSFAGGRFVEGGQTSEEIVTLMQALNIIRKDVAKALKPR